MSIDWTGALNTLDQDTNRYRAAAPGTAEARLFDQGRQRRAAVQSAAEAFTDPTWETHLDTSIDAMFNQAAGQLQRSHGQALGQATMARAARGALGGSGAARTRGQLHARLQGGREQVARAGEGARQQALDLREQEALGILGQLLAADPTLGAAIGAQGQGLQRSSASSQALADLDQRRQGILSTAAGQMLSDAGRFGAAGFDYADLHNRRHPSADPLTWFN